MAKYAFEVMSSHGSLFCSATGCVLVREICTDDCDRCIGNIIRIDVWEYHHQYKRWPHQEGRIDILDLGYWLEDTTYVPPCEDWRQECREIAQQAGIIIR